MTGPHSGGVDPAQPMIDWINNAPPADLAVELLSAYQPTRPRRVPWLTPTELGEWMFREYPQQTGFLVRARPVQESILEAVQLLEHSELVYLRWMTDSEGCWNPSRLGLAMLAEGKAAVRQRIRDRTGL